jgi:hypothetical protein
VISAEPDCEGSALALAVLNDLLVGDVEPRLPQAQTAQCALERPLARSERALSHVEVVACAIDRVTSMRMTQGGCLALHIGLRVVNESSQASYLTRVVAYFPSKAGR